MSWDVFPWVYPVWDSLGFLDFSGYFLPHFREVFSYYLLQYFLMSFLFVFFFWDSYDSNVRAFHIVPEVPEVVLISFNSFFFLSASFISTILSCTSLSFLLPLLFYCWYPPECFWSHLLHYSFLIDSFLISSRSLLNISCIFSILFSRLFICNSILFSRF